VINKLQFSHRWSQLLKAIFKIVKKENLPYGFIKEDGAKGKKSSENYFHLARMAVPFPAEKAMELEV
jgi:hypothetical protein